MLFWQRFSELSMSKGISALKEVIPKDSSALERSKKYREEIPCKSDDELLEIVKCDLRKAELREIAARKELKSRGYNDNIINLLIRS